MLDNDVPGLRLVHGEVAGRGPLAGKIFGHAWVEVGDTVVDPSNGRNIVLPKDEYYRLGKITNTFGYDREQALVNMLKHRHWGPWDMSGETRTAADKRLDHFANADQAKRTGGMISLYPRPSDADMLAIPGGEAPSELHCTLVFLGDDVPDVSLGLAPAVAELADYYTVITATVTGHATFNPAYDPVAVYLLNEAPIPGLPPSYDDLTTLQTKSLQLAQSILNLPPQHLPYIPHITAKWGGDASLLGYTGEIQFDRLGLSLRGLTRFFPLIGAGGGYRW